MISSFFPLVKVINMKYGVIKIVQDEVNKDCAINVMSEIEDPLSKQSIFDELPFEVNIQHYLMCKT